MVNDSKLVLVHVCMIGLMFVFWMVIVCIFIFYASRRYQEYGRWISGVNQGLEMKCSSTQDEDEDDYEEG